MNKLEIGHDKFSLIGHRSDGRSGACHEVNVEKYQNLVYPVSARQDTKTNCIVTFGGQFSAVIQ